MAESLRLQTPSRSNRTGEASPSFAQTTAEFSLDSDLDLDPDDDDDDAEDLRLHEAQLGGGQAYELKSLRASPAKVTDDGWGDEVPSLRRRASISTVASFQLYTPDEERSVIHKHDRKLVVFVALLFMLNIGNARIAGMDEDLQTNPPWDGWYEWTLTAFYISYIFFEWMSLLWKLIPAHIYVSMIVLSWGLTASLQSVSVSYPTLIFLRVLLGIGEAGFTAHLSDRAQTRSVPIVLHALASAGGYAALALAKPIGLSPLMRYLAVYPAAVGFFNVVTLTVAWSINNQASESRQGGGFALMQIIGQCGPLVGTRLYPDRDAPFYAPGMQACAGAMLAVAVLAVFLRFYLSYLNRKTDAACAVGSEAEEEEEGLVGSGCRKRTASEGFRYML
ncbi:uncharacterized protein N0V96_006860 [Colletotrichum fioriniae]|uniref:uncharacterized protein n=1 Tax=Colletotrichum fioriniae TaxID=710243 RepID=UPI0032DA6E38|nr:hypothetical protein N0V96_006860 [Colletotrichum fioriniae]